MRGMAPPICSDLAASWHAAPGNVALPPTCAVPTLRAGSIPHLWIDSAIGH